MSTINLEQPITSGGIEMTNFFNGRLLSGEDLTHEQGVNLLRDRRLGQALGTGIVCGLEARKNTVLGTTSSPVLTISRGLALNRDGQTLWLPNDADVSLIRRNSTEASNGTVFQDCTPPQPGVYVGAEGIYLLTIEPAEKKEGRAPVSGLGNVPAACNSRYIVSGVQFRLIDLFGPSELGGGNVLRNRAAYRCFGFPDADLTAFLRTPFASPLTRYGKLDSLPASKLSACEVPLAIVYWTGGGGVEFIDLWSVRRRITHPDAAVRWDYPVNDRRQAEAEAIFFQFQDQIRELLLQPGLAPGLKAEQRFDYLPPAGILQVGAGAFGWSLFLGKHAPGMEIPITSEQVRPLLWRSLGQEPVKVIPASNPASALRFHVYRVAPPANYIVFARSTLNESIASDVYFDNSYCHIDGAATVQSAIDGLCKTHRGCCSFVVADTNELVAVAQKIAPGQNAQICVQAGNYNPSTTVLFENKGHLQFHGAGLATRLVCAGKEAVLAFRNCASVSLNNVHLESGAAAHSAEQKHLNGVATFLSCPDVTVESVSFRCAATSRRAVACVTVRHDAPASKPAAKSTARIRGCQFQIGSKQVGILLVNVARSHIEDNVLRVVPGGGATAVAYQGVVVGGVLAHEVRVLNNSITDVLQGVHIGLSHRESTPGPPDSAGFVTITGNAIKLLLASPSAGDRHGIFVGSCACLTVEHNRIDLERKAAAGSQNVEGIRIFGQMDRRLIVRGNDLTGFTTGILFEPLNIPAGRQQWIITDNLARSAGTVLQAPAAVRPLVRGANDNFG